MNLSRKITITLLALGAFFAALAQEQLKPAGELLSITYEVHFSCDMEAQILFGNFDPASPNDHLYVRGSFNSWTTADEMFEGAAIDSIYEATLFMDLTPVVDVVPYKYMYASVFSGEVWESGDNRQFSATGAEADLNSNGIPDLLIPLRFFDDVPPPPQSLTEPVRFPLQHPDASNNWACPLALSNGDVLLFWSAFGDLTFSRSTDGGQTWESPGVIASTPGFAPNFPEGICTPGGRAIITWSDTQTRELMRSYSDDQGVSWSSPAQITSYGRNERWTSLCQTLDGTLWLFYSDYVGNARDIFYCTSSDNGDTWSAEQTFLATAADEQFAAVISADPSTLLAFYSDNSAGNYSIYQVSSGDGGQTWSPPTAIGEVYQDENRPRPLRRSNGTLQLIYVANTPAPVLPNTLQSDVYSISNGDGGSSWSLPQRFTQYAGNDGSPGAALLNDQPFVTFISSRWTANLNQNQVWYGIIGFTADGNPPPALLNRQILTPLPGQPVTARAFVDDESGISGVAISYSVNGVPAGPFPMYDDGMHNDDNPGDNVWGTNIGPFQIGDTIAYSFSINDISANTVQISAGSFEMPAVHTAGNVILSVYENAKLADETTVTGRSAYWPASGGHDYLYMGGLWVGAEVSGEQRVMNVHYSNLGGIDWIHTAGTPITVAPGVSDQDISLRYDDQLAQPAPLGLQVRQESYQWSGSTRDDFITFRYTIKNTGLNGDLNNVYAAVWLDPDISSQTNAGDDMGGYDSQRGLAYLYDPGQNPAGYLGIKLLGANPHTANLYTGGDPNDDAQRFQFMTAGILPNAGHPSDWRILLTAPPFYLAAGDSYTVAFGLVMGNGLAELQTHTDSLIALAEDVWGIIQPPFPFYPPNNVIALDKFDGKVPLYWDPPAGFFSPEASMPDPEPGEIPRLANRAPLNAPEAVLLGYNLYRGETDTGPFVHIASLPPDQHSFQDEGVSNGQVYYYYLTGVYDLGEGLPSNMASGYPLGTPNASGKAVSHAKPGGRPYGIAFDGSSVWMCNYYHNEIVRYDPVTWQPQGSIPAPEGGTNYGLGWDGASLWAACIFTGLYQIDLSGNILQFIDVPQGNNPKRVVGAACENGRVWTMELGDRIVHTFDAASGMLLQTLPFPPEFQGLTPRGLAYLPNRGAFMVGVTYEGNNHSKIYEVTATDFTLTGREFEFGREYDPGNGDFYSSVRGVAFNPLNGNYWIGDVWTDIIYEAQPFPWKDFGALLHVSDNAANIQDLWFGAASYASDGFDPDWDLLAPPLPPTGAFDARFRVNGEDFINDYRASNTDTIIWNAHYQPSFGGEPVTLSWNSFTDFPRRGTFHLRDPQTGGSLVYLDMWDSGNYTDNAGLGHLQILYDVTPRPFAKTVAEGWNLVSLPGEVADGFYLAVFPNAQPQTLFNFSGSYRRLDYMEMGSGYWLKFPQTGEAIIYIVPWQECKATLAAGWNMIGGPSYEVALTEVYDPEGIIIPGTLHAYNGAYYPVDFLQPGEGYWLRASNSGEIIPIRNGAPGSPLPKLADLSRFSLIEISDASGAAQKLYFGAKLENGVSMLRYSLPPVPPAGGFDARFTATPQADDYRLIESDEGLIRAQSSFYPLILRFSNLKSAPNVPGAEEYRYTLTEMIGNQELAEHLVSEGEAIVIANPQVNFLRLGKVGGLPTVFAVSQNYPNPFNPVTEIQYALPQPEKVEIVIYNALGQKVKTLVSQHQEAGYYTVAWDAANDAGQKVGSGIYFYRVKAGKHSAMKKMALVR